MEKHFKIDPNTTELLCPGIFFVRYPNKRRIVSYFSDCIWHTNVPSVIFAEIVESFDFDSVKEKVANLIHNLVAFRVSDLRKIKMDFGNLNRSDSELRKAMFTSQLMLAFMHKNLAECMRSGGRLKSLLFPKQFSTNYERALGVQPLQSAYLCGEKGNNPHLETAEEWLAEANETLERYDVCMAGVENQLDQMRSFGTPIDSQSIVLDEDFHGNQSISEEIEEEPATLNVSIIENNESFSNEIQEVRSHEISSEALSNEVNIYGSKRIKRN